jgi:hypothetical protein
VNPQLLLKFLPIALQAILPVIARQLDPNSPEGKLAGLLLQLLPQTRATMAHAAAQPQLATMAPGTFGAAPSVSLPPEEHWTSPEALMQYAASLPPADDAAGP